MSEERKRQSHDMKYEWVEMVSNDRNETEQNT